jgi:hypothetical protein
MIPDHSAPRTRKGSTRWKPRGGVGAVVVLSAIALIAACSSSPLFAPTGTTITLFSNSQIVALNGSAQITASVLETGGNAVQDGTTVTFASSLGTMSPTDATTHGGKATSTLFAGSSSGTAEINAYSGANSAKTTLKIVIGAAAVNTIVLNANPSTVSVLGGTSTITALVLDTNNNPLPTTPVTFSTDQGTVSPIVAVSDANGSARTTLTTTQAANVTVTAGTKKESIKIGTVGLPAITITPPASPSASVVTNFSITIKAGVGAPPIQQVTVDFRDGSRPESLGQVSDGTVTVPHIYVSPGFFTIRVTATDASGQSTFVELPIQVFPAVPFNISITAPSARVGIPVTLTATPASGSPAVLSYTWNFGDGPPQTTTSPSVTHIYLAVPPGNIFTVTVSAVGADGRTGNGSTIITVTL